MNKNYSILTSLFVSSALSHAALINIAPFGSSSLTNGAHDGNASITNPHGGNDGKNSIIIHTDTAGGVWDVVIPKATNIARIDVINRGSPAGGSASTDARLNGTLLEVLNASNAVIFTTTLTEDAGILGDTISLDNGGLGFAGATKVRLSHTTTMNVADVQLFADSVATGANTSGAAAFGYATANGVDGNFQNFTHGGNNTTDFWQVDLGSEMNLDWLSLTGREGFEERANNATISLLAGDGITVVHSSSISGLTAAGPGDSSFSLTSGYTGVRYVNIVGANYLQISEFAAFETVPEPSSTALIGLGGLALLLRRKK